MSIPARLSICYLRHYAPTVEMTAAIRQLQREAADRKLAALAGHRTPIPSQWTPPPPLWLILALLGILYLLTRAVTP